VQQLVMRHSEELSLAAPTLAMLERIPGEKIILPTYGKVAAMWAHQTKLDGMPA